MNGNINNSEHLGLALALICSAWHQALTIFLSVSSQYQWGANLGTQKKINLTEGR